MQGRDSTLQLVSSASFGYCRMLICWWKESYGGHFGPVFAEYIKAQNARPGAQTTNISLESLTIINGWINPIIQVGYRDLIKKLTLALNKYNIVRCLLQLHGIGPLSLRIATLHGPKASRSPRETHMTICHIVAPTLTACTQTSIMMVVASINWIVVLPLEPIRFARQLTVFV